MENKEEIKNILFSFLNSQKFMSDSKYSCKMYCKHCGAIYIRSSGGNRQFPVWSCKTYRTKGVKTCSSPIIKEMFLDKMFISIFDTIIKNRNEFMNQILKEYTGIIENNKDNLDIAQIERDIEQINKQKDKLLDLSIKGMVSDSEFKSRNDSFNSDIEKLVQKKDILNTSSCELERLVKKVNDIKSKLNEKVDIKEQLPNLMKLLIERIEIEKVDDSRKNIKATVYFNFTNNLFINELNISKLKKTQNEEINIVVKDSQFFLDEKCASDNFNPDCTNDKRKSKLEKPPKNKEFQEPKCLSVAQSKPRICSTRTKTR